MVIGAENHNTENWARLTLERLRHDNLPPTPNNYSLFFYYYSDQNPNLKMAMDTLIGQHGALTQAQCDDLHRRHLGLEAEHRILKQANEAIETEINHVLGVIDQAATGTTEYTKTLDSFSGKLEKSASLEQIREAVTKVVNETRVMAQQNERLQTQLTDATEQLTEMRYNLALVHKESQVDPLTEVGNRKFFDREIEHAVAEAAETSSPLTLLMIDIDHFKRFNDSYGHQVGDQVLRLVARTLVESLKGRDVIARYGGEEFVILLPQTRVIDAEKVANQLRATLGSKQLKRRSTNESLGVITVSIGAAEYAKGEDIDRFIERADQMLYKAKQTGRNRVVSSVLTENELAGLAAANAAGPERARG